MRGVDIHIGRLYLAKVSGKIVTVEVLGTSDAFGSGRTSWRCLNHATGREILVRSAQRFRGPAPRVIGQSLPRGRYVVAQAAEKIDTGQLVEIGDDGLARPARPPTPVDQGESGPDYGGAFDGHTVTSDADPGL